MRRLKTTWIYEAGALVSAFVFRFTECPDSLFACLSVALAVDAIVSMLRMCDRLLDPPVGIFVVFSPYDNNRRQLPIAAPSRARIGGIG